jgi:hypothetical protein|tara:strand:+ start:8069 stop:9691 length:1623 start_codon:yes stop_codon:yes gene_type:complete
MPNVPDDIAELLGSLSSGGIVANTTTGMTLREHVWIECLKAILIANPKQNSLDADNPEQRQITIRQNIMLACTYATWWFNSKYYFDNCINPGLLINGDQQELAEMQETYPGYPINNTIVEEDMGIMTPFFEWGYIDCVDKFAVTVNLDDNAGYGCGWDFCEIELAYREFPGAWQSGVVYNKIDIYQPNQSVYMPTWTNIGDATSGYDDPNMGTGPFTAYPSETDRDNDTNGTIMCPNLRGMSTEDGTSWRLYPWFYSSAGCDTWSGGATLGSFGGIDPLSIMQVRVRVKCDCDGAFGAWTTYSMISPPTPAAATSSTSRMAWTPLEFGADLALWLDSQVGITKDASDRVTSWLSRDASLTEFTQASATRQPLWTNTHIYGVNDNMQAAGGGISLGSSGMGHSITFRGFFEGLTTSTNLTMCSHTTASSAFFRLHGKNRCDYKAEGATDYLGLDTPAELAEDTLYTITICVSPAFIATLYIDGVAQVDQDPVLPVFILDEVMAKNGTANPLTGGMSHMVATYKELDAAEVLQLHEYLEALY